MARFASPPDVVFLLSFSTPAFRCAADRRPSPPSPLVSCLPYPMLTPSPPLPTIYLILIPNLTPPPPIPSHEPSDYTQQRMQFVESFKRVNGGVPKE